MALIDTGRICPVCKRSIVVDSRHVGRLPVYCSVTCRADGRALESRERRRELRRLGLCPTCKQPHDSARKA